MTKKIVFGCGGAWAAKWFDDAAAAQLIETCLELGVRHFDTGPTYGSGLAEQRLGRSLARAGSPDDVVISTKVGSHRDDRDRLYKDYSAIGMRTSLEASLERLGVDHVDLVLTHGPIAPSQLDAQLVEGLVDLRERGLTAALGASCDGAVATAVAASGAFDAMMATLNMLDVSNLATMQVASQSGLTVIAKAPLAHGASGFPRRPLLRRTSAWYNARLAIRRPRLIVEAVKQRGELSVESMLGFVASHECVDQIVIGTTSVDHLRSNLTLANTW